MQQVFTDGACSRNGRRGACAGIGVYFGPNDPRNVSDPLDDDDCHTNQRAELYALGTALEILLSEPPTPTILFSDSEYAINCITRWANNWRKRGWKKADGEEVKNLDIIKPTVEIWDRLQARGASVTVAHVQRDLNTDADALAVDGARLAKNQCHASSHSPSHSASVVVHKAGY